MEARAPGFCIPALKREHNVMQASPTQAVVFCGLSCGNSFFLVTESSIPVFKVQREAFASAFVASLSCNLKGSADLAPSLMQ